MIRRATTDDLATACAIIIQDYQKTGPEDVAQLDLMGAVQAMYEFTGAPSARVLVYEEPGGEVLGVCCFTVGGFLWNPSVLNAVEVAWAVRQDIAGTHGGNKMMILMADAMIEEARSMGATMFTLGGNVRYPAVVRMLERRYGLTVREMLCAGRI